MKIITVISKEFSNCDFVRQSFHTYHFVDWFVEALNNAMNEFIFKCRSKPSVTHQYIISFKFDEKKDTVDCIFDYSPYISRCYDFLCHGNSWTFRSRKQLINWVESTLVKFGCEFSK